MKKSRPSMPWSGRGDTKSTQTLERYIKTIKMTFLDLVADGIEVHIRVDHAADTIEFRFRKHDCFVVRRITRQELRSITDISAMESCLCEEVRYRLKEQFGRSILANPIYERGEKHGTGDSEVSGRGKT